MSGNDILSRVFGYHLYEVSLFGPHAFENGLHLQVKLKVEHFESNMN